MNIKHLPLLFILLTQIAQCTHDGQHLLTTNAHTAIDYEQGFQEIKFIYIDSSPDLKQLTLQIISAVKDSAIKGIILLINCRGGSMTTFSMLHDTIKKARQFKPIVAVVTHAVSGGYLITAPADYVIAHSCSEVGSIGVIMELKHFKNACLMGDGLEAEYNSILFKAGEFKDIYQSYGRGELSEKEKSYLQKGVDDAYDAVVALVAEDRGLNKEEADIWANAKEFMAHEALELGLIDQIGTLFDAEEKIVELIQTKAYKSYPDYKIKYSFCNEEDEF